MNKTLVLAAVLTLATACDPYYFGDDRTPSFVSKMGVRVYQNGVEGALNEQQVNEWEELTWQVWVAVYGSTPEERQGFLDCMNGAYVEIYARDTYRCNDFDRIFNPDKKCIGQYSGGAVEITADTECSYYSPYGHEIIHMQQWCRWGRVDPNHNDLIWEILRMNENPWKREKCEMPIDF